MPKYRRGMDCKAAIEDFAGAMVFSGQLPQTHLVGHWCEACFDRREEVRRYRQKGREVVTEFDQPPVVTLAGN